jgi:transcription elongation factor Elf1
MGSDTFRCPQCGRVLALADDTYNPDTRTCRACGRGETPPVPEARTNTRSASDVAQTELEISPGGVARARWTQPTEEEVAPPKVS